MRSLTDGSEPGMGCLGRVRDPTLMPDSCPGPRLRASWAPAGVHRRRVSGCYPGPSIFSASSPAGSSGEIGAGATSCRPSSTVRTRRAQAAINNLPAKASGYMVTGSATARSVAHPTSTRHRDGS